MGRPPGTSGRSQLKPEDLLRIQTLNRDAKMGPKEIERITGYSPYQIKYAIRKKTPTIAKRTGRPPKNPGDPSTPKAKKAKQAKTQEQPQPTEQLPEAREPA
ncbi:hypothetical protein MMYC01_207150 [Madurella mycetomatis]|uniref:Uncharacterized protein n=1 Tax=Madurella mycetomatis TaxID=100816 RepID=A0A175W0L1_9PEZI|nr:hypothetical protein MMYC01_207150 [Madurella mycetomatis]